MTKQGSPIRWIPFALAALATTQAHAEGSSPAEGDGRWQLLSLSARRRVFFKYEKRIRDLSPPDKVFNYFASVERADGARQGLTSISLACMHALQMVMSYTCMQASGLQRRGGKQSSTLCMHAGS